MQRYCAHASSFVILSLSCPYGIAIGAVMYALRFPPSVIMCASFWCVLMDRHFERCSFLVTFEICYRIVKN